MTILTDISSNYKPSDYERFAAKVDLPASDIESECWIWQGAKHGEGRGYGKFKLGGRCTSAHKASHLLFNGPVPAGMVVGHVCNNEACCNPNHLVAQSQSDNMKYAVICGRHNSCH